MDRIGSAERCARATRGNRFLLRAVAPLLFLTLLTACPALPPTNEWSWTLDPSTTRLEWDSGRSDGRATASVDCPEDLGEPNALLVGVTGYRRDRGSDQFMSRLIVRCRKYVSLAPRFTQIPPPNGPQLSEELTSANNYVSISAENRTLTINQIPIGVIAYHDGKRHLKNIQLIHGSEENGVLVGYVSWRDRPYAVTDGTVTSYPWAGAFRFGVAGGPVSGSSSTNSGQLDMNSNKYDVLLCPSQAVVTQMFVAQNDRGKIRTLSVFCQQLTNNQP